MRKTLLLLIILLLPGWVAFAQNDDGRKDLEKHLSALLEEKNTVVALAKLDDLKTHYSSLVPRKYYFEALKKTYAKSKDPILRFSLYRSIAWSGRELQDMSMGFLGEKGIGAEQGCLRKFGIVGPFDNPSMESYDKAFGPELGEIGPFVGRFENVDWRKTPQFDYRCVVSLNHFIQPSTSAVVYVSTSIESEKAKKATLLFAASSAYKVWVNGDLVGKNRDDFGLLSDADAWKFSLKKGTNVVLIKLASTQEGGFVFQSRVVDQKDLRPLQFKNDLVTKSSKTKVQTPTPDSRGIRMQMIKTATLEGDAAAWAVSHWAGELSRDAATPWRNEADRLLKNKDSLSTLALVKIAETYEEYWKRRDLLEEAHKRGDYPETAYKLSRLYDNGLTLLDSRKSKNILYAIKKPTLRSIIAKARWEVNSGSKRKAEKIIAPIASLDIPAVLGVRESIYKSIGSQEKLAKIQSKQASQSYVNHGQKWSNINKAIKNKKPEEALKMIRDYRQWVPASVFAAKREARLLEAMGNQTEALAIFDQWISWSPGMDDLYKQKAKLLSRMGKKDEAIATLKRVLIFNPQDQNVKRRLAFLTPQQSMFYAKWVIGNIREEAKNMKRSQYPTDTIIDQSITKVSKNGLSSKFSQRVNRVNTKEGIEMAQYQRAYYQGGEEDAEVVKIIVHKKDGTSSENFDSWDSGGTRKQSTTYNDSATLTMKANDVEIGDLVEYRFLVTQIAGENFRGDYFGDIAYLQNTTPIGFERYAVIYPDSWKMFFRKPKLKHTRVENKRPDGSAIAKGFKSTAFDFRNVKEVKTDSSQPGYSEVYDYLLVSNKETYDQIGTWWWDLVEEQLIVDEEIRKKVKELTKGKKTERERLSAIHNYVVKNTRYLHVGLGIHGWKPYRTTTCFRNRYGDCKDKASLLKVMLEEAGIPANLVLVRTRSLGDLEDYPASMHIFNHAITYVPKYDLFLDGTAEFNGTNELTSMDQGARGLIIEDGGKAKWVKLPVDKAKTNLFKNDMYVKIDGKTNRVRGKLTAFGTHAVYFRQGLEDPERRNEVLEKYLSNMYSGATLVSAKYKNLGDLEKEVIIDYVIEGGRLLHNDGNRDFLLPMGNQKNLLQSYANQAKRNQVLTIRTPFANQTKVHYVFSNRSLKTLPEDVSIKSRFGSLKITYKKSNKELIADVEYSIDVQRVSVDDYKDFRAFLRDATQALNSSIEVGKE